LIGVIGKPGASSPPPARHLRRGRAGSDRGHRQSIGSNRLPVTIAWLSDNGSCYIAGRFAHDIGLEPRTTPTESPQSNGMAEAFLPVSSRPN
jgi:transposase InsO family protein